MKNYILILVCALSMSLITSCGSNNSHDGHNHNSHEGHDHGDHEGHNHEDKEHNHEDHEGHDHGESEEEHEEEVHLSQLQFNSLGFEVNSLSKRNMSSYISVNGHLEVSPQYEASVTAVLGSNVVGINVIEGDQVSKGQVLAYVSHPNLIKLQTDYVSLWNDFNYLETEYNRQKELYDEKITSGKVFQKISAEYNSTKGNVGGLEAQLKLMGINLDQLKKSVINERVPIIAPIAGFIKGVEIKIGQYVEPQTELFEIVNLDHIHSDFMVFEKDMHKVKKGQKVIFSTESIKGKELEGIVFSIGKSFEENPKAVHIHAEIENKEGLLIPGMYVSGKLIVNDEFSLSIPSGGVVRENDKYFIFIAEQSGSEWEFKPIEVAVGLEDNGWTELKLLKELDENQMFALNSAYYLMTEMKKGEAEHSH